MPVPRFAFPKALKALYDYLDSYDYQVPLGNTAVTLAGASATACTFTTFKTTLTTSAVGDVFNMGSGAGRTVGERKLIVLGTLTAGGHTVVMDHANMLTAAGSAAAGCVLDAANEYVLFEWTGAKWRVVHMAAGVVT